MPLSISWKNSNTPNVFTKPLVFGINRLYHKFGRLDLNIEEQEDDDEKSSHHNRS